MAFDSGRYDLTSGQTSYTIPFGTAFGTAPDVVVAVVENATDNPFLTITVTVVGRSTTDFDIELSQAPDSNNYDLVWFAGSPEIFFEVITQYQRKMTKLPATQSVPNGQDLVPFVQMSPVPRTMVLPWRLVEAYFTRYKAEAPNSPTDPGEPGQWAMDANYIFFHNGTQWGRFPVQYVSSWADDFTFNEFRRDEETLPQAATHSVVFSSSFPAGNTPVPKALFVKNTTGGDTLYIGVQLTALDLDGFTVALTGVPDSGDYKLFYEFEQLP